MAIYTERIQTVLTRQQLEILSAIAEKQDKPISILVREAIEEVYIESDERKKRQKAVQELFQLNAPIADWDTMEQEIIDGANQ